MDRRLSRALTLLAVTGIETFSFHASAEPNDAAALELAKKAIYTDYLGTKFDAAEKKLKQALALCKPKTCSPAVVAQLHRDLGVVYVGGMSKRAEGKAEFAAAVAASPAIKLDQDLTSEDIEAVFQEAGGTIGAPAEPPSPAPSPGAAPRTGKAAEGDLIHAPPAEQATMTPVPVYAELPQGVAATKVILQYRPFGSDKWKTLEMRKVQGGHGVEIPCADVGSITGDLKYFIQAFDADNNVVAFSGTRAAPISVEIRSTLEGTAPSLPGQPPPTRCVESADCPPGLPGCESKQEGTPEDAQAKPRGRKNWVSLGVQQDWLLLSGQTNTCSGGEGNPYTCFDGDRYYANFPYERSGGELAGGFSAATTRILAGYDRAIGPVTLGLRLGFAFRGGPQAPEGAAFVPVHVEARVAYWFGADPFARKGIRPYITLGGGMEQIDARASVTVYDTEQDFVSDKRLVLDAWKKSGLVFVTAGAGAMFAIGESHGPVAEFKFTQLFGASGSALSGQLGYAVGF